MAISRSHEVQISGSAHHGLQKADLKLRESTASLDELKQASAQNGRDEIIFEGKDRLYVLDAVKLCTGEAPAQVGEHLKVGPLAGKIVHVGVDAPRAGGWASVGALMAGIVGAPLLTKLAVLGGVVDPVTATVIGSTSLVAAFIGAPLIDHRPSNDEALSQLSTTLAADKGGNFAALEAQLSSSKA